MRLPNKPILAYGHNAARVLCSVFRLPPTTEINAALASLAKSPDFSAPFDPARVYFVPEQISVVPQVLWTKPKSSTLFSHLCEHDGDVHLVSDAFKPGREGLYFCRLARDREVVIKWLSRMKTPSLLLNQAGDDLILAAPVGAFAT